MRREGEAPPRRVGPPAGRLSLAGLYLAAALVVAGMAWVEHTWLFDPERNGGRSMAELHEHNAEDGLVGWGWHPGEGREPAPGSQEIFGELTGGCQPLRAAASRIMSSARSRPSMWCQTPRWRATTVAKPCGRFFTA